MKFLLVILVLCPALARAEKGDLSAPSAKMASAPSSSSSTATKAASKPAPVGDKHALRIDLKK